MDVEENDKNVMLPKVFLNSLIIHQVLAKEMMTVVVFGYLILINKEFYYFISKLASLNKEDISKRETLFTTFPNTLKFVRTTPLRAVFSTLFTVFSVFGNAVERGLSC